MNLKSHNLSFSKYNNVFIIFQGYTYKLHNNFIPKFKYKEFLPGIYVKINFFKIYIEIKNNLDNIHIYINNNLIFSNYKSESDRLYDEYSKFISDYDSTIIYKGIFEINVDDIVFPNIMGGTDTRCSLQDLFRSKFDLYKHLNTNVPYYEFSDILTLTQSSTLSTILQSKCKISESCSERIINFKDDDKHILKLIKFKDKFFLDGDGSHRICCVKKSNRKFIRAKIYEHEYSIKHKCFIPKLNNLLDDPVNILNPTFNEDVIKDFDLKMNSFNIDKNKAREILNKPEYLHEIIDKYKVLNKF